MKCGLTNSFKMKVESEIRNRLLELTETCDTYEYFILTAQREFKIPIGFEYTVFKKLNEGVKLKDALISTINELIITTE